MGSIFENTVEYFNSLKKKQQSDGGLSSALKSTINDANINPHVVTAPHTLDEYEIKYKVAEIPASKLEAVKLVCNKIMKHQDQYQKVEDATGVPWFVVASIHHMESGLDFSTHLHNGDPLTKRTYHVPAGRPKAGSPPFAWYESAIDALGGEGAHKHKAWPLGYCLSFLETYNGLGYRKRGLPTPYLWSYTDQYVKGRYVADGKFDPNSVSKQIGCVAVIKTLGVFKA